jgi:FAD:protein FMN transferase
VKSKTILRRAQLWLGTLVEIGCSAPSDAENMHTAFNAAFLKIQATHERFSFQSATSELNQFNRSPVFEPYRLSTEFMALLVLANDVYARSDGFFDPCAAHRGCIAAITTDTTTSRATKTEVLTLDLSGIAKGYAVDLAIESLQNHGITSGWVNAGGDLRVFGLDVPKVHIRLPDYKNMTEGICVNNAAVASSGNYFHPAVGVINPKSKHFVPEQIAATVQATTCVVADALCKAALLLPPSHAIFKHYNATVLWRNSSQL